MGMKMEKKKKIILEDFTSKLDQKIYNVMKSVFINQANNPPILICIEKR
jgi:hypothetical protein